MKLSPAPEPTPSRKESPSGFGIRAEAQIPFPVVFTLGSQKCRDYTYSSGSDRTIITMNIASDALYFALHPNQLPVLLQWWV